MHTYLVMSLPAFDVLCHIPGFGDFLLSDFLLQNREKMLWKCRLERVGNQGEA